MKDIWASSIVYPLPLPLVTTCHIQQTSLLLNQAITACLIGERHQDSHFHIRHSISFSQWCWVLLSPCFRWGNISSEMLAQIIRGETMWVRLCLTSNPIFLQGDYISCVSVWDNYFLVRLLILHSKTGLPLCSGLWCKHSVLFPSQGCASKSEMFILLLTGDATGRQQKTQCSFGWEFFRLRSCSRLWLSTWIFPYSLRQSSCVWS